jgi:large subunit ribosomal protein L32
MALPKRKTPHSRTRTRRAHLALHPLNLSPCPKCGSKRLPHRVCAQCGYYDEKVTIETEE